MLLDRHFLDAAPHDFLCPTSPACAGASPVFCIQLCFRLSEPPVHESLLLFSPYLPTSMVSRQPHPLIRGDSAFVHPFRSPSPPRLTAYHNSLHRSSLCHHLPHQFTIPCCWYFSPSVDCYSWLLHFT